MDELRSAVETGIRTAFAGVQLGHGVSLRQAQVIDNYGRGVTDADFDALPRGEIIDDWSGVPLSEIERDCTAHLDGEGLRYYLPARMLTLLDHYDGLEMWVIGTISALAPRSEFQYSSWWLHSFLTDAQKAAIAAYVRALPQLVELDADDEDDLGRGLREYWRQYLPTSDAPAT